MSQHNTALLSPPEINGVDPSKIGLIVVDHGSRRAESNDMLLEVVSMFRELTTYPIVEAAHMELAAPSIADAFDACVARGAEAVVVHPYFLLPGRHWAKDIPHLTAEAASKHPSVKFLVTQPLGLHELMVRIMDSRIHYCVSRTAGEVDECPACAGTGLCRWRGAEAAVAT